MSRDGPKYIKKFFFFLTIYCVEILFKYKYKILCEKNVFKYKYSILYFENTQNTYFIALTC